MEHSRIRTGLLIMGIGNVLLLIFSIISDIIIYGFDGQYDPLKIVYIFLGLTSFSTLVVIIGNHISIYDESSWFKKSVFMYYVSMITQIGLILYLVTGNSNEKAMNITIAINIIVMFVADILLLLAYKETCHHLKCRKFLSIASFIIVISYIGMIGCSFALPYIDKTTDVGKLASEIVDYVDRGFNYLINIFLLLIPFIIRNNLKVEPEIEN